MTIDEIIKHYEQVLEDLKAYKEQSGDCISRQAAISAIMGEYPDAHYPSYYKSKIDNLPSVTPQPCEDAISREELIEALNTWDKFGYAPTNELVPLRGNVDKDKYVPYIHYDDVIECIKGMPSVTPQQRTGKWEYRNIANSTIVGYWCDNCHIGSSRTYNYCPNCGAKIEVEE